MSPFQRKDVRIPFLLREAISNTWKHQNIERRQEFIVVRPLRRFTSTLKREFYYQQVVYKVRSLIHSTKLSLTHILPFELLKMVEKYLGQRGNLLITKLLPWIFDLKLYHTSFVEAMIPCSIDPCWIMKNRCWNAWRNPKCNLAAPPRVSRKVPLKWWR